MMHAASNDDTAPDNAAGAAYQALLQSVGVGRTRREKARRRADFLIGCALGLALFGWVIVDLGADHAPPTTHHAASSKQHRAVVNKQQSGDAMPYQTTKPSKQTLQQYLEQRRKDDKAPPTPDEIRRQLGWNMRLEVDMTAAERLALPER